MLGLLAPLLVLAVAFGIDVTTAHRNALRFQTLTDWAASSGGPLALAGDTAGARAVAEAIVRADGSKRFEFTLAGPAHHLLADLITNAPHSVHAVASGARLVE